MILNKLSVLNYKNIRQADIVCSPKINCFFGNNGMGKTNLLDAIYYLSFCKSHVYTTEERLLRRGEDLCVLQGEYFFGDRTESIFFALPRGQRKQFKRNQKPYPRLSDHIGLLPLVMISPSDAELIRGGSDERRRWMDMILSQYDGLAMHALIRYNKALQQRNRMLREQSTDTALYEVLEMQLAQHGQQIFDARTRLIEEFLPFFDEYYRAIGRDDEAVGLRYISQLQTVSLEEELARHRERERREVGYTTTGIHKDDLEMTLDSLPIRHLGSQGQNKTCLVALKLAQYSFLSAKNTTLPILLLDDIFDKLDATRVEHIVRLVGEERFGQIFITDTNRKYLDSILESIRKEYAMFHVDAGMVTAMEDGR